MITIVDYGMGNLGSIRNMLQRLGCAVEITSDPTAIAEAAQLILPGVGHFDTAMKTLRSLGLVEALNEAVLSREVPVLGLCLGQHLITRSSEEGEEPGLGWIDAETRRISAQTEAGASLPIPHMGWNSVDVAAEGSILGDPGDRPRFYFVHSYAVFCDRPEDVLGTTSYGVTFHSAIQQGNVIGVQFHPEKSHAFGYRLLARFAALGSTSGGAGAGELVVRSDASDLRPSVDGEPMDLPARVIPVLQLRGEGLVKTEGFDEAKYVGDPRNAVKIFNEKQVDELVLIDIDATRDGRPPNLELLEEILSEAFMPVAYGGGIRTIDQARQVLATGAEKVILNSAAVETPGLVGECVERFGAQSVVISIDVKRTRKWGKQAGHEVRYRSGTKSINTSPAEYAKQMQALGAGELLLQSIDRDGTMSGYDLDAVTAVSSAVDIPVVACGGAGSVADLARAVTEGGASAVAAGSLFVFKGPHRAVLITYPDRARLAEVFTGHDRLGG